MNFMKEYFGRFFKWKKKGYLIFPWRHHRKIITKTKHNYQYRNYRKLVSWFILWVNYNSFAITYPFCSGSIHINRSGSDKCESISTLIWRVRILNKSKNLQPLDQETNTTALQTPSPMQHTHTSIHIVREKERGREFSLRTSAAATKWKVSKSGIVLYFSLLGNIVYTPFTVSSMKVAQILQKFEISQGFLTINWIS